MAKTLNLDALERAAVAGTMAWKDAHTLVSLSRKLLRLRVTARDFYNITIANPELRLSTNVKKVRDDAVRAGERLREMLEATDPGADQTNECGWILQNSDYGIWEGACGAEWLFPEGGPSENSMKHCPNCGKRVQLAGAEVEA